MRKLSLLPRQLGEKECHRILRLRTQGQPPGAVPGQGLGGSARLIAQQVEPGFQFRESGFRVIRGNTRKSRATSPLEQDQSRPVGAGLSRALADGNGCLAAAAPNADWMPSRWRILRQQMNRPRQSPDPKCRFELNVNRVVGENRKTALSGGMCERTLPAPTRSGQQERCLVDDNPGCVNRDPARARQQEQQDWIEQLGREQFGIIEQSARNSTCTAPGTRVSGSLEIRTGDLQA
jgi:hypothetical protein